MFEKKEKLFLALFSIFTFCYILCFLSDIEDLLLSVLFPVLLSLISLGYKLSLVFEPTLTNVFFR